MTVAAVARRYGNFTERNVEQGDLKNEEGERGGGGETEKEQREKERRGTGRPGVSIVKTRTYQG